MKYTYNDESLIRHGAARKDVDEVLSDKNISRRDFELLQSIDGNLRLMFVGFNSAGRLLEIGVQFIDENYEHIFHAQAVSPKFHKLYEELIKNEQSHEQNR